MAGLNISPYQAYNQTHNYSSLFSGMNKAASDNGWDLSGLADYASIKNGSYGKLVRSSYAKANESSSASDSNRKSTIMTAEQRRAAREAAKTNSSKSASSDKKTGETAKSADASSDKLTGAAARRAAREARINKTAATGDAGKALTRAEIAEADVGAATADAATAIAENDSAKAFYNSNAVASPTMAELMASTFDVNA